MQFLGEEDKEKNNLTPAKFDTATLAILFSPSAIFDLPQIVPPSNGPSTWRGTSALVSEMCNSLCRRCFVRDPSPSPSPSPLSFPIERGRMHARLLLGIYIRKNTGDSISYVIVLPYSSAFKQLTYMYVQGD